MSQSVCIVNGNDQPLKIQSDGVSGYAKKPTNDCRFASLHAGIWLIGLNSSKVSLRLTASQKPIAGAAIP